MNIVLLYHIDKSGLGGPGLIVRQVSKPITETGMDAPYKFHVSML